MFKGSTSICGYALILSTALPWHVSVAQQAPAPQSAPAAAADAGTGSVEGLAEVVVTAERRSENLRDVPVSVVAVTPDMFEKLNLPDLQAVQFATPGMVFAKGINYSLVSIRGIGSFGTNPGLEPAVATYIDGAYLERGFGAVYDVVDPASVEVLRGPQGTLWGRNATGGAIVIRTADPSPNFDGKMHVEAGSLGHMKADGMLNVPLSDTVAARIAIRYREEGGYVHDLTTGGDLGWNKQLIIRGKLAWTPNDSFSSVFEYQYDRGKSSIDPAGEILPNVYCLACVASAYKFPLSDPYTTVVNNVNGGRGPDDRSNFYDLRMTYTGNGFTVTNTAGYRKTNNFTAGDFDFTELPAFNLAQISGSKAFTESLLFASDFAGIANFSAGFDYLDDTSGGQLYLGAADTFDFSKPLTDNTVKTKSYSGFAEVRIKPASAWTVTAGGRYSHDKRTGIGGGLSLDASFSSFTPRVVVAYDSGSTNYYFSYNRGFKAGGFSGAPLPANIYQPEKIDSYELGAKYFSPSHALRANAAIFEYKYKNIQVTGVNQSNVGNIATANNAGAATGKGAELELEYQASEKLYFFGGLAWLDAKYDTFNNAQVQVPVFNAAGQPTGFGVGVENLSGFSLARAPRWSGNIGVTARAPLPSSWTFEITPSLRYSSKFYFTDGGGGPLRADTQTGFAVSNVTGKFYQAGQNYDVDFFVNNATNRVYDSYRFSTAPFGAFRIVTPPRSYGVGVTVHF